MRKKYEFKNYEGEKFGYATVVEKLNEGKSEWIFLCDCGKRFTSPPSRVIGGYVRSCGCKRLKRPKSEVTTRKIREENKDSLKQSGFYPTWRNMMQRCYNPNHNSYKNYGAKGVYVCEEWHNPKTFVAWAKSTVGSRNKELSLDRKDNHLPYCPSNCQWVTRTAQTRNRGNTIFWTIDGEKKTLAEWCEQYNMPYTVAHSRKYVCGWDELKCLTTPAP